MIGKRFLVLLTSISLIVGSMGISSNAFAYKDRTEEELKDIYDKVWNYEYKGETEEFTAPMSGSYKVQLWGARGGLPSDGIIEGGRGAYVEGIVNLLEGEKLNINVGEYPGMRPQGGFNGGGNGFVNPSNLEEFGAGGGGATDIRKGNIKQAVAAGGAGGGVINFANSSYNGQRSSASGGGSGGEDQGQTSGAAYVGASGKDALYANISNYRSGGGSQSRGGQGAYNSEVDGSFGKGGDGASMYVGYDGYGATSSFGGGGGAGYYGGAGGFYRGVQQSPSGGGGSSYIDKLEKDRIKKWIRGWDTQPSYRDSTQNRSHNIEKHGHVTITKANEPPSIRLKYGFENGKAYKSMETYKNTVAIKDRDLLGGNVEIWSSVKVGNSLQTPVSHGEHLISMEERDVNIDIFIPEYRNGTPTTGEIKIWAVDKEGLRAVEIYRTIGIEIPNYTKIEVIPGGKSWSNGGYNARIVLTDPLGIYHAKVIEDNKIIANTGRLGKEAIEKEITIPITENKSINLEIISWGANGHTQKHTLYFNNISTLKNINRTKSEIKYEIKNYGVIEELTQWEVLTSKGTQEHFGSFNRKTDNLEPNEKVQIRYKLFDLDFKGEINGGWTPYQAIHSLSKNAEEGELISYTKNSAELTFKPNTENSEKPMYQFRAIQTSTIGASTLDDKRSVKVQEGTPISIKGLIPNTEYRIETTTFNGDDVGGDAIDSGWTHLKDNTGKTIIFKTRGSMEFSFDKMEDWITDYTKTESNHRTANVTGKVSFNGNQKLAMYINVGSNNRLKVSDDMMKDTTGETTYNIEIRKNTSNQNTLKKDTSKTNAINQYILETSLSDGKYDVWIETEVEGYREEYEVGWLGIDTKGPQSKAKPIYKKLMSDKGMLTLNTREITDLSTPTHEITIDYGKGRMPIFSEKMITFTEGMEIKLYDKLENFSILKPYIDLSGYVEGSDYNPDIEPPTEKPSIPTDDNVVEVEVPKGGSHMQTSLDGVTWSVWEPRVDVTYVTLPVGDGYKTVYVRTGQEMLKDTPVFNTEHGTVEMVQQKGGEIIPLNNTKTYKYVMDLTAPKLEVRTMDNMLIAINGNITFLLDVVDNLDKTPKVKIEILERDGSGTLKNVPVFNKEVQISEGTTTGSITPSKLPESKSSSGKLQPYTLRVTAWDRSNNRTVKHVNFYVKNK